MSVGDVGAAAAAPRRRTREIVMPEGVPLVFQVASLGDRLGAFLLDSLFMIVAVVLVAILAAVGASATSDVVLGIALVVIFLVRSFYFLWFEFRWQGSTPGKRAAGLRVISRHGGPLRPAALFARNLTRELEFYLPVMVLVFPDIMGGDASPAVLYASVAWMLVLGSLPLFHRDRLRLGDVLGGTLVVRSNEARLQRDPGSVSAVRPAVHEEFVFTSAQLDEYGVYELQVLEGLLRDRQDDRPALEAVARKIRERIRWQGSTVGHPADFLEAFYRAQRRHLERDLLLGEVRERKRAKDEPAD